MTFTSVLPHLSLKEVLLKGSKVNVCPDIIASGPRRTLLSTGALVSGWAEVCAGSSGYLKTAPSRRSQKLLPPTRRVAQQTPSAPRRCWAEMEGSVAGPLKFKSQDYEALRGACLQSGSLFSDPLFPADQGSIGMPPDPDPAKAVKWLRPKDISANAMFVEGTTSTTDICQGQLGNCWFLAALSCLTMHPTVFVKVVPLDQSMTESYAGIFRFRFWQYGEWVEVVVDDSLPVCEGRLLFSYSCTKNEFWSALVEKAYAKLNGSYGSLKGGNISEGMEDFTGGIAYTLSISSRPPQILWKLLNAALSRGSLLSCFIQAKTTAEIGQQTSDGLVRGHAYAITDMDKVKRESEEVLLLRLRNPWGFVEYTGPWSDKSKNWDKIDKAEKKRIKLKLQEDGEFWIGVEDFCKLFNTVELCSVNPDSMSEDSTDSSSSWSLTSYKGSWVPGCSAGGNRSYPRTFWKNPQFQLLLSERNAVEDVEVDNNGVSENDEDDADPAPTVLPQKSKGKRCTALVELLQRDRRQKNRINFLYVAFHIFRIQDNPAALNQSFFSSSRAVGRSGKYQAVRGVWRRVLLEPGQYIIVVSTQKPNVPGDFFLRVYTKSGNTLEAQDITCPTNIVSTVMSVPALPEDHTRVQKCFDECAGGDDRLNAVDFMKLVNSVLENDYQLPLETCRQLIFTEDTGGRGRLNRTQAEQLVSAVRSLQSLFVKYDEDSSGSMSPFELTKALEAAGVQCDGEIVQVLWERFGSGELHLPFHAYVSCVTRLKMLHDLYESESSLEVKNRGINAWLLRFLTV
uniref:Uncharacterized protein n=1 Tax=Denticeps clupeoides TaxID=299321 RepID=A0AAY4E748_9TELE